MRIRTEVTHKFGKTTKHFNENTRTRGQLKSRYSHRRHSRCPNSVTSNPTKKSKGRAADTTAKAMLTRSHHLDAPPSTFSPPSTALATPTQFKTFQIWLKYQLPDSSLPPNPSPKSPTFLDPPSCHILPSRPWLSHTSATREATASVISSHGSHSSPSSSALAASSLISSFAESFRACASLWVYWFPNSSTKSLRNRSSKRGRRRVRCSRCAIRTDGHPVTHNTCFSLRCISLCWAIRGLCFLLGNTDGLRVSLGGYWPCWLCILEFIWGTTLWLRCLLGPLWGLFLGRCGFGWWIPCFFVTFRSLKKANLAGGFI